MAQQHHHHRRTRFTTWSGRQPAVANADHGEGLAPAAEHLRALTNACLTGLDGVLRHIVHETACDTQQARPATVLPSILYSSSCLSRKTLVGRDVASALSHVQHLVDTQLWLISSHTELCRTLLQLLYTLVHIDPHHSVADPLAIDAHSPIQHVQAGIRAALASLPTTTTLRLEKSVEAELYGRITAVHHALLEQQQQEDGPPAYEEHSPLSMGEDKPPQYSSEGRSELELVLRAIDRLSHVMPRLDNQRVQRPPGPPPSCNPSRFKLCKKSASAQVDRRSLYEMTDLLVKSLHRPCFTKQRYHLSADKERDLFMNGLFNKVDRLEGRRLSNQDAEKPSHRLDELDQILNNICRAKRAQFDNQRATFTVHSS